MHLAVNCDVSPLILCMTPTLVMMIGLVDTMLVDLALAIVNLLEIILLVGKVKSRMLLPVLVPKQSIELWLTLPSRFRHHYSYCY